MDITLSNFLHHDANGEQQYFHGTVGSVEEFLAMTGIWVGSPKDLLDLGTHSLHISHQWENPTAAAGDSGTCVALKLSVG